MSFGALDLAYNFLDRPRALQRRQVVARRDGVASVPTKAASESPRTWCDNAGRLHEAGGHSSAITPRTSCYRFVRRTHHRLQPALWPGDHSSRVTPPGLDKRYHRPNGAMDCLSDHRGLPVGRSATLPHPGPRSILRCLSQEKDPGYGHPGSTNRPPLPWQNGHIGRLIGSIPHECPEPVRQCR
jgi:hypothetical protein